jgi:hypothetical protein
MLLEVENGKLLRMHRFICLVNIKRLRNKGSAVFSVVEFGPKGLEFNGNPNQEKDQFLKSVKKKRRRKSRISVFNVFK